MTPIFNYLSYGILPPDKVESIRRKAIMYYVRDNILYQKTFRGLITRCVGPIKTHTILQDIHNGICGIHSGYRAVAAKALRMGYYWPIVNQDAEAEIKTCQECRAYASIQRAPNHDLIPITNLGPYFNRALTYAGLSRLHLATLST
ncbi:reverse transcriptase domain-containing protein [Tanacetum coccineum]